MLVSVLSSVERGPQAKQTLDDIRERAECLLIFIGVLYSREVPTKEAKDFAESIAAIFMETSARNAVNIEELFQKISKYH